MSNAKVKTQGEYSHRGMIQCIKGFSELVFDFEKTDMLFVKKVASEGRHTFISTGMTTEEDITKAVEVFRFTNCPFTLMNCVSTYPMKEEDANLNAIKTLRDKYNCYVGYSGHETGLAVSVAAVALGITSLERHITLDRSMWGTDQSASLSGEGLYVLSTILRKIPLILGDGKKRISSEEKIMLKKFKYW